MWHLRTIEVEFGDWLATELVAMLEGMLAETELRAYRGDKIVEVKPIWANKGASALELLVSARCRERSLSTDVRNCTPYRVRD